MRKPSGIVLELDKYFHGEEKNWEVDYLAKPRFEELNTDEEVVGTFELYGGISHLKNSKRNWMKKVSIP